MTALDKYIQKFPEASEKETDGTEAVPYWFIETSMPSKIPDYDALLNMAVERKDPVTENEILAALNLQENPFESEW
jgi:hypothetical protein